MKLLNNYSFQLGQSIDKIHTFEKYYPLSFNDYIVFQPISKGAKNFDYFDEVISLIFPLLEKQGIKIVQVGAAGEKPFNFCYHTQGSTSFNQLEYLISKAKLVLTVDSISSHLAGHYNIPLVCLTSNNYKKVVEPYYGNKDKQIIFEPDRKLFPKPSFSLEEPHPKQVNSIKAEDIAAAVCKLLNLEFFYPFSTIKIGLNYQNKVIESACDNIINTQLMGLQTIIMRLDYTEQPNWAILLEQAKICKISIISDKVIPINLLQQIRPQIQEVLYIVNENHNPQFCKELLDNKIPFRMISFLPDEKLNVLKLDYIDLPGIIFKQNNQMPPELKDKDLSKVFYKSSKITIAKGKFYMSKYSMINDIPCDPNNLQPEQLDINKNPSLLWSEQDYILWLDKFNN